MCEDEIYLHKWTLAVTSNEDDKLSNEQIDTKVDVNVGSEIPE
jgi:hypothetical protein